MGGAMKPKTHAGGLPLGWILWVLWMVFIVAMILRANVNEAIRSRELRRALFDANFIPCSAIPRDLLRAEPNLKFGKILSVYEGKVNGHQSFVFDLKFGKGKGSYSQTFVAVQRVDAADIARPPLSGALGLQ